ncbi:unnamed protein product [Lymnaea stagnalis]|uniref:Cubilin n=1 Tax=Lymnaea stagnalis TaxID=6523 RepID=A0AAV2H5Z7_LYMST
MNGGTCVDMYNGYFCRCPSNWQGTQCTEDVNECAIYAGTDLGCQNGATCTNTQGSFICRCTTNWYGIHCSERHNDCAEASHAELCGHGTCVDETRAQQGQPRFRCICNSGWTQDLSVSPACTIDIDECALGAHCSVSPPVTCRNIPGSFLCESCPPGYTGNGFTCYDINECLTNNGGCSTNPWVDCVNTVGSMRCGHCPEGYEERDGTCVSSPVCSTNNGGCDPRAECQNNGGLGVTCLCPDGYAGNGRGPQGCVPISSFGACHLNPCQNGGSCTPFGQLQFTCNCVQGYSGPTCNITTNACASNPCLNGGICTQQGTGFTCVCNSDYTGPNCGQPQQECGGRLTNEAGSFRYPRQTGVNYPHGANCNWIIVTTPGKVLSITFPSFSVELTTGCRDDYLQVYDGPDSSSRLIGTYCGVNPLNGQSINSTQNQASLLFHSDHWISSLGFTVNWTSHEPVCGYSLMGQDHGAIRSPGYPTSYPHNIDCVWTISVRPGSVIDFHFAEVSLEAHSACFDYLEIHDGQTEQAPILQRFCNSVTPPPPIRTTGPFAFVRFHTDGDTSDRGFSITYAATAGECGGNLTGQNGEVMSPGYPSSYRRNTLCVWNIWVPTGYSVVLTFDDFDLLSPSECMDNSLVVRDGQNQTAPLLANFCGAATPALIRSSSNVMYLELRSIAEMSGRGFKALWSSGCGGTFTGSSGQIHSPGWPNIYPTNTECIYNIQVPQGHSILLSFNSFDLEGNLIGRCYFDYVEVYDNIIAPGNQIGNRLCSSNTPEDVRGGSNQMVIKFVTDYSVHGTGFQATYTAVGAGSSQCGGVINANSGNISSPQHPNEYPHGINCTWYLTVDPGHVIRLMFHMFSFETIYSGNTCIYDFLEVYDNSTMFEGSRLGRYCGSSAPPFLTSSDNVMVIYMETDSDTSREGFRANFVAINQSHICGSDLRTATGVVTSPNYPGSYPHDRECEWTITVPEGNQIFVNITDFELEGPYNRCPHDYLDIRQENSYFLVQSRARENGGYLSSPALLKLCGNQPAVTPFISHSNRLYLKFKSDHSVQKRGFRLEYSSGATGCGGLMTTPTGGFVSPNYPGNYNHNSECVWTIVVSRGSKIILVFVDLDVEGSSPNCYDYIEVHDGGLTGRLITRLCGTLPPHPITSNTNKLWIKYKTDYNMAGRGFRAQYFTNCNTTLTGQYGVIESPNFPNNYPHLQNCNWTIEVSRGSKINVTFATFILEYHSRCLYDYVEIIDGSNTTRLCGPDVQLFSSSTNKLYIHFKTDASDAFNGFRLEWIKDGCGGRLTGNSGGFTSPGYPNPYPAHVICTWEIIVELGMSVEFTLHTFDVESSTDCRFDALEVHSGSDRQGFQLIQACHRQSGPQTVTSSGNTMFVYFESDYSIHGTGFNATYKAVPNGCGGKFSARNGRISSKNFPETYDHNSVCEWLITVEQYHAVALTFLNFHLEGDNCTYDYVDVYDGNSTESTQLGHFCDIHTPPAFRSTGNQMFIKMVADSSQSHQGFLAEYKTACGGNLNADVDGEIMSPLYPHQIALDSECIWIISSGSNTQRVTLHFTAMDINETYNCSLAWVAVNDGRDAFVAVDDELQNRYCGSSLPASITSHGSSLRVQFKSGGYARGKGFRAVYSSSHSSCGGEIKVSSGRFTSPLYPDNYPDDIECVWQLTTPPGNALQLSFPTFELTEGLNNDYVEIRTPDVNGELAGRWAGNTPPSNLTNFFGAWIKFRSNEMDTARGFTAEWSASTDVTLTGNRGQIASPKYPSEYPQYSSYRWTIGVAQNMSVRITFETIAIQGSYGYTTCLHDYVEFFDGPQVTGTTLGRFCGINLPESFESTTNEVTVVFVSDGYLELSGFLFTWEAVLSSDLRPSVTPYSQPTVSGCGGNLVASNVSQELTTPGYPGLYANNLDCYWTVVVPLGYRVLATIQNISLEVNSICSWDYVEFLGNSQYSARLGKKYCKAEDAGVLVQSNSNLLTIHFRTDESIQYQGVSISLLQGCGGYMPISTGIISSPNYPADYPSQQNCSWKVSVNTGKTIRLTFDQPFNIADTGICSNDYLKLLNGFTQTSPPLIVNGSSNTNGTYCGMTAPQGLTTSSSYLFAQFVSDGAGSGAGFSFNFSEISVTCGGHLRLTNSITSGYFMSPNYPQDYPENVDCTWIITSPMTERIKIDFEETFYIEPHNYCDWDYLVFHDGGTLVSPRIGQPLCGSTLPGTVLSTENIILARFRTDNSRVHPGFKAKYSIATCGGRIRASNGVITSPKYPDNYDNNQECEWFIVGPIGHFLTINVTSLNIQSSENCSADVLEVRDGNATDNSLFRSCGLNDALQSIETSDNIAYVRFKSDGSRVAQGFRIVFQASLGECGGQLTTPSGVITSPNFPGQYPHNRRCEWVIIVSPGRSITLTFTDFRLEQHYSNGFCPWDYVEIYNGNEEDSPSLGHFCHDVIPGPIQSSGNVMKVIFRTDRSESFNGFRAVYSSDSESECGGYLTESSGVITSPLTNISNSHNRECIWQLRRSQPNQTSVRLTLGFLNTEGQYPCIHDYLEVREGIDSSGALIKRFCGQVTPTSIFLPVPDVWIRYKTDRSINSEGFNLSYEYTNCGGIYTDNEGVISSPNYPVNSNQNTSCAWQITAPEGSQIRIEITDFDFPLGCHQENLTLQNGGYYDSPQIGTYCNQTRPPNFVSQSNALRLTMVNGISATNRRGFRMTYRFESGGCGGLFHADSGVIRSPNYPRSYPHNVECRWDITVALGYMVKLKFQSPFDLEADDCHFDYVQLYDVSMNGSLSSFGSYCNNTTPPDQRSKSNRLVVIFRSDIDTNGNGFSANWSSECGGIFTSEVGTVYSPGYPNNYPNNANCLYTIQPPDNKLIFLSFVDFAVQGDHYWCSGDYVTIDGDSSDEIYPYWQRRFCGTSPPQGMLRHNQMFIRFISDQSRTMKGFQAQYNSEDCGGNLTDPSGIISTSPFHNSLIGPSACTWTITVETNKIVNLKLLSFEQDIRYFYAYCNSHYLDIHDGSDTNAPLLAHICGDLLGIPSKIKSSNNTMFLKYVTSDHYYLIKKGFQASYSSTYGPAAGCGGTLRQSSGTIRSLDIDNNGQYEPDLDCHWLIYVGENKLVTINITGINIAGQSPCQGENVTDQLTVYEGTYEEDQILGRFCSQTSDQYLTAGSNVILVVFKSDSGRSAAGFTATFGERDPLCGGAFNATSEVQTISSPNYPSYFNQVLRCNWFIDSGSNDDSIKLEVTDLHLEACSVTDGSSLSFEDRPRGDAGQSQHICGTTTPSPFYSTGQRVKIVYNVPHSSSNSTFQLNYSLSGCSRNYTQSNARITSPGFPKQYSANHLCIIQYQAPVNTTLALYFRRFSMEYHPDCHWDSLEIFNSLSVSITKLCNEAIPSPIFLPDNIATLKFMTDYSVQKAGYDITIISSTAGSGCGGVINETRFGAVTSPGYPGNLNISQTCSWLITPPSRTTLYFKFTEMNNQNGTCSNNYVAVYQGTTTTSPLFGRYCNVSFQSLHPQEPGSAVQFDAPILLLYASPDAGAAPKFRFEFAPSLTLLNN